MIVETRHGGDGPVGRPASGGARKRDALGAGSDEGEASVTSW